MSGEKFEVVVNSEEGLRTTVDELIKLKDSGLDWKNERRGIVERARIEIVRLAELFKDVVLAYPEIDEAEYKRLKGDDEDCLLFGLTQVDDLITDFKANGIKIVFGKFPETGTVFVISGKDDGYLLPDTTTDTTTDTEYKLMHAKNGRRYDINKITERSLFPKSLEVLAIKNQNLRLLCALDNALKHLDELK